LLLGGCDSGPKIAPVRGYVTYNGKPVTVGKIWFYPEFGRPALGVLGADGTYVLGTNTPDDGALVGVHRVTIHSTKVGPGSIASLSNPQSWEEEKAAVQELTERQKKGLPVKWLVAGKIDWLVPKKYFRPETSPLTATVENKKNEINFEIPGEKP
jgi:hypothetical protein